MEKIKNFFKKMSFTQILMLGYSIVILLSAILLSFPVCSKKHSFTAINDCIFTAVSAISGTGLVLFDTYEHWSVFGQIVLLIVIQIGGIGFMSMAIFALSYTGKKIGLKSRATMRESVAGISGGGIVKMTRFILKGTIIAELLGSFALMPFYIPRCGVLRGIYYSVFHSVSAFCTAGIDLMGYFEPGSSLMTVKGEVLLNVVVILLLTFGGIGYITWHDISVHKWHFKKYRLQSKLVIFVTVLFYIMGLAVVLALEWNNALSATDSAGEKFLMSSMLVTSARDAGFTSVNITSLSPSVIMMIMFFMFIGGAPGSTACGVKVTTFAVMTLSIASVFRKRKSVECFGRRIDDATVRSSCCIITLYLMVIIISTMIICAVDGLDVLPVTFEVISAISSCGLSMGITAQLSDFSAGLITLIMFFGRIGGISFIVSLSNAHSNVRAQLPEEKIMVG